MYTEIVLLSLKGNVSRCIGGNFSQTPSSYIKCAEECAFTENCVSFELTSLNPRCRICDGITRRDVTINYLLQFFIAFSNNCTKSDYGFDYIGTLSRTVNNNPCINWTQIPTSQTNLYNAHALGNYCRNMGERNYPYCYTSPTHLERCELPRCRGV